MSTRRHIIVELTPYEARTLLNVAANGFGDGEFFIDPDGSSTGYGDGRRSVNAYARVCDKIERALDAASKPRGNDNG